MSHLKSALSDNDMPPQEVLANCTALLDATDSNSQQFPDAYQSMEEPLFKNFSRTAIPYAVKGHFNVGYAWLARGHGYSDSVSQEGAKPFAQRLGIAAEALEKAWKMDSTEPFIPTRMISVRGEGRDQMELWFQRAMKANPRNVQACKNKLNYLKLQWYGSYEEMVAFRRECVTNAAWSGYVTSFLVDVHQSIADMSKEGRNYWKRPGVWEDIHAAFEEFFRRNPEVVSSRYNYAWYANACEGWDVVNQQLPLLSEPINYNYFGGRESFELMRKNSKAHTKK